jgi:NADPH:quinone reductase-like Zn-dependent oxidoreductase
MFGTYCMERVDGHAGQGGQGGGLDSGAGHRGCQCGGPASKSHSPPSTPPSPLLAKAAACVDILKIAVAAGANVVAITSSDAKADRLLALGARHVINYRKHSNWGELARGFTPQGRGIDHVVDVVGATTMAESLSAIRLNGLITVAGMIGGPGDGEKTPDVMSALSKICVFRGIFLGSRSMFRDMVQFLEQKKLRPALDDVVFRLEDAKSAFERLEKQQHFSKVVIKTA